MAPQSTTTIEEELAKLREKQERIEKGNPPVGIGTEHDPYREIGMSQSWPIGQVRMKKIEPDLLDLLRRTAEHIGARNAVGEKSKDFCAACHNGRHENCILPEIWTVLEEEK